MNKKKTVCKYLPNISQNDEVQKDLDLIEMMNGAILNRSKIYTAIVDNYSKSLEKASNDKRLFKQFVFWTSLAILIMVTLYTFAAFIVLPIVYKDLVALVVTSVPVVISFLTVFIAIPKIIAKYLFNPHEEKYMSSLIGELQRYDISMMFKERGLKSRCMKNPKHMQLNEECVEEIQDKQGDKLESVPQVESQESAEISNNEEE